MCPGGPRRAPLPHKQLSRAKSRHKISQGETSMTIFDPARTRVIDAGGPGGGILRLIGLGIIAFVLVILLFSSVTRVGTGHVGVLTLFGRVTNETLGEGIHLINPLKTNNEMSVQTQTLKESANVPSSEGLMMALDTSIIYHLNAERAAEVFQKIGADYETVVVEPLLRSAIREATASHSANALYTGEREMVAKQVHDQRSEERRVGKECRSRWSLYHEKKKKRE